MGGVQESIRQELDQKKGILLRELKDRSLWFVRLRWWVPPCIAVAAWAALEIGFAFPHKEILLVAGFILLYNIFFYILSRRYRAEAVQEERRLRHFAYAQVGLDYAAMFLLAHFTGGATSPFLFFFLFHIIFTSILLPRFSAYGVSVLVAAGVCAMACAEHQLWLPHHSLFYRGADIVPVRHPVRMGVEMGVFAASVFITAWVTSAIMTMLRTRIRDLGDMSDSVTRLNNKLNALFSVIQAIGSAQRLEQVLSIVTSELQLVMGVRGISVKMLSEDGRYLRYAAAYGLPDELFVGKEVELDRSLLNRRIVDGEPYLTGNVTEREKFQFGEALEAAHIKSVLFVPLTVEARVIGILGAYCVHRNCFTDADVEFFRLAAGLVAIAIENARAYEANAKIRQEGS
jgi:hypothetical protein